MEIQKKGVQNLRDSELDVATKAVHQIVVRGLTPRTERTSCVTAHDAYLMASILKEEPVHLPVVMMKHMESCAWSKSHGLPFPGLVKMLLINAGLYEPRREVPLSYKFDTSSLREVNRETGTKEQDELKEMVKDLRMIHEETLFWVKKLVARLPKGRNEEETSGTGSGDA